MDFHEWVAGSSRYPFLFARLHDATLPLLCCRLAAFSTKSIGSDLEVQPLVREASTIAFRDGMLLACMCEVCLICQREVNAQKGSNTLEKADGLRIVFAYFFFCGSKYHVVVSLVT